MYGLEPLLGIKKHNSRGQLWIAKADKQFGDIVLCEDSPPIGSDLPFQSLKSGVGQWVNGNHRSIASRCLSTQCTRMALLLNSNRCNRYACDVHPSDGPIRSGSVSRRDGLRGGIPKPS